MKMSAKYRWAHSFWDTCYAYIHNSEFQYDEAISNYNKALEMADTNSDL